MIYPFFHSKTKPSGNPPRAYLIHPQQGKHFIFNYKLIVDEIAKLPSDLK